MPRKAGRPIRGDVQHLTSEIIMSTEQNYDASAVVQNPCEPTAENLAPTASLPPSFVTLHLGLCPEGGTPTAQLVYAALSSYRNQLTDSALSTNSETTRDYIRLDIGQINELLCTIADELFHALNGENS